MTPKLKLIFALILSVALASAAAANASTPHPDHPIPLLEQLGELDGYQCGYIHGHRIGVLSGEAACETTVPALNAAIPEPSCSEDPSSMDKKLADNPYYRNAYLYGFARGKLHGKNAGLIEGFEKTICFAEEASKYGPSPSK